MQRLKPSCISARRFAPESRSQGLSGKQEVCWSRYLFTSMHLSRMASAIGLLRKMEGELEKQRAFI